MRLLLICTLSLICSAIFGQYTMSGIVTNEKGEKLEAALVFIKDLDLAAITDRKGYYELANVPSGQQQVTISYLGYQNTTLDIQVDANLKQDIVMRGKFYELDKIEIISNRIDQNEPFTYENLGREYLQKENLGQDVPYLLQYTPSAVVTSDAGTGIGYTGIRIRGTDPSRINVTINGIALNDSESQGVFWVDLPDFMSSVNDIQIQRGVGPSTNGAGAFGATVSLNTQDVKLNEYIDVNTTYGSFNTQKLSLTAGTGLLDGGWTVDGRYSIIKSDGYIDRGTADMNSWYLNVGKISDKSSLRFLAFGGHEITGQAWYGVPESRVKGTEAELLDHYNRNIGSLYNTTADSTNLFNSGRSYNYYLYDNQVDNYRQNHYQLLYSHKLSDKATLKTTLHYTKGKGFFEQFKYDDDHEDYGLTNGVDEQGQEISSSDIVRKKWLDNDYFGITTNSLIAVSDKTNLEFGLGASRYIGGHFGQVISAVSAAENTEYPLEYYRNEGNKTDANIFARANTLVTEKLTVFADLQGRYVDYDVAGVDDNGVTLDIEDDFTFFNPKAGINYAFDAYSSAYASVAVAHREPARSDFIDAISTETPKAERLTDLEVGYKVMNSRLAFGANVYYMSYKDQLIPTGDLNDVGSALRVNVPESYRTGLELVNSLRVTDHITWDVNATFSQNRISEFTQVVFDYTTGYERIETTYDDVAIGFSPEIIAGSQLTISPFANAQIAINSKYVGKQYLDNTQNEGRKIDPYFVNNLRINYSIYPKFMRAVDLTLMVNNIFDTRYSSNGYTYSYIVGDTITENYLYPQAGINFLLGANFRI